MRAGERQIKSDTGIGNRSSLDDQLQVIAVSMGGISHTCRHLNNQAVKPYANIIIA